MIGIGMYEYQEERILMTFARLPPPAGHESEEALDDPSALFYRKVNQAVVKQLHFQPIKRRTNSLYSYTYTYFNVQTAW